MHIRTLCIRVIFATWFGVGFSVAVQAAPAALPLCQGCHQADGSGNIALGAPTLAGQQQGYLLRQLQHFQSGGRGSHADDQSGAQMRSALPKDLTAADLTALASHFAALPAPAMTAAPADATLADKGRRIYINSCGACHGGKAEGVVALKAPKLRLLDAGYLQRQMVYFRSGVRGTDPADKPGRQMARMALTLKNDAEIDQVIAYIGSLP